MNYILKNGVKRLMTDEEVVEFEKAVADAQAETLALIEKELRKQRDGLLLSCDWTQLPNAALTDEQKADWEVYRQALRDITSHANWPNLEEADWPVKPA